MKGPSKIEIEPIDRIPPPVRVKRKSMYDDIISKALNSESKYFKVKFEGNVKSVYQALFKRIRKENLPLKLHIRGEELFIENLEIIK